MARQMIAVAVVVPFFQIQAIASLAIAEVLYNLA